MSGGDQHGGLHGLAGQGGADHVRDENAFDDLISQANGLAGLFGDQNRIFPSELGHRVRPLLHPPVIEVAAIVHSWRGNEGSFQGSG